MELGDTKSIGYTTPGVDVMIASSPNFLAKKMVLSYRANVMKKLQKLVETILSKKRHFKDNFNILDKNLPYPWPTR
jgi:hypothetical protein